MEEDLEFIQMLEKLNEDSYENYLELYRTNNKLETKINEEKTLLQNNIQSTSENFSIYEQIVNQGFRVQSKMQS